MPNLHNRIKRYRKKMGLSQADLAAQCGVSQPTVANWERGGHIPRQEALFRIADCFGVDTVWLLSGEHAGHQSPSFQYMDTPIRHIPIFEWTSNARHFNSMSPIKFQALSTQLSQLFGVTTYQSEEFTTDTTLFFDKDASLAANARFLVRKGRSMYLMHAAEINIADTSVIGRLVYSLTPH